MSISRWGLVLGLTVAHGVFDGFAIPLDNPSELVNRGQRGLDGARK
jgi:hypothetical protein